VTAENFGVRFCVLGSLGVPFSRLTSVLEDAWHDRVLEDRELRFWARKETTAYHPFDDRFPESPNVTVPKLTREVILVLSIGFDSIYTQFLSRREGWGVVDAQY